MGLRCTQSLKGALHSLSSREPPSVPSAVLGSRSRLLMLSLRRFWDAISCEQTLFDDCHFLMGTITELIQA